MSICSLYKKMLIALTCLGTLSVFSGMMGCSSSSTPNQPVELVADANTVLLMHFNETIGTITEDSSPNHFIGNLDNENSVLVNPETKSPTRLKATREMPGYLGNSLSLMMMGEFVSVPSTAALNMKGDLTLELWVHPSMNSLAMFALGSATHPGIMLVSKRTGLTSQQPYTFGLTNNGSLYFEAFYPAAGLKAVDSSATICNSPKPTPVQVNIWQHLAMTRSLNITTNSVEIKLFYNGEKICDYTDTADWGPAAENTESLLIGYDNYYAANTSATAGGANNFALYGQIDELKMSSAALSEAEIKADFTSQLH